MDENEVLKPKNGWELLRWVVYEPELLREYSASVKDKKERPKVMIKPLACIVLTSVAAYLFFGLIVVCFNMPSAFPNQFKLELLKVWGGGIGEKLQIYFAITIKDYLLCLIIGLALCLQISLSTKGHSWLFSLSSGLALCLAIGLLLSLKFGLIFGLVGGGIFGLVGSFERAFRGGMAVGLLILLFFTFEFGVIYGTGEILQGTSPKVMIGELQRYLGEIMLGQFIGYYSKFLIGISAFLSSFMIFYYRFDAFLWYSIKSFFGKYSLSKNPHWRDGLIGFPIFRMEKQFRQKAYEMPEKGEEFSLFLYKRRYQRRLGWQIYLTSKAGYWRQNRLLSKMLKEFPRIEDSKFPYPSTSDWYTQLETTRKSLSDFEQESNVQLRVRYFKSFKEELDKLYNLALYQPREWNEYFVKALDLWKKSAVDKLRDLEEEAVAEEPIAANIYRGGEKLKPEDKELFLGRQDLRDAFKKRVVTAVQMPLFFVQGQRRVGKSSLIAFLPTFLDRGFTVISIDMQEYPGLLLTDLLQKLRERIYSGVLGENAPEAQLPENWLDAWQAFRDELENIVRIREGKIVLAIDEYEELHKILQANPEQGGALLGAMRSWSQSQNRVVFLFAGADFFSELKKPNWAEYFVQAERLYVDYLGREDTFKLINLVGLKYPPELLERMYRETQGHPCLLQKICREIVTIANKEGRESRTIVEADYEEALRRVLLVPDDGVVNIFWQQFCENRGLKDCVRQILRGETPVDEKALLVLEDHRFIVRDKANIQIRVPLFELWLRRYQVT